MNEEVCRNCNKPFCRMLFDLYIWFDESSETLENGMTILKCTKRKEIRHVPVMIFTDRRKWLQLPKRYSYCAHTIIRKSNDKLLFEKNAWVGDVDNSSRELCRRFDFGKYMLDSENGMKCPCYAEHLVYDLNKGDGNES